MPGTKSSDRRSEHDVPGRHYATGPVLKTSPQAYCLPGRIFATVYPEDFVPGYRRFAPYCLPGS